MTATGRHADAPTAPNPRATRGDPAHGRSEDHGEGRGKSGGYARFGAMIATAMVSMFVLTYVNAYALDHVRWSETRFYMTFVMGAAMAVIMLAFMSGMYRNRKVNVAILCGSLAVFVVALWLVRSQATVEDRSYMRAMIPHHSIAILTSEGANFADLRVRELADEIAATQRREIAEMSWLIEDIGENGPATTEDEAHRRPVPEFEGQGISDP